MKGKFLLIALCVNVLFGFNHKDKSKFDIITPPLSKRNSSQSLDYNLIDNSKIEASLSKGGYFTLGTKDGISSSYLDDNCSITFGHPYAKTSHPVFAIDGLWNRLDSYFGSISPREFGDYMKISGVKEDLLSLNFDVLLLDNNDILLKTKIINLDTETHSFGLGMFIDPAIGKWNDCFIESDDGFYDKKFEILNKKDLTLWEKSVGSKGIGVNIESQNDNFSKIIADNWHFAYDKNEPELSENTIDKLYDVLLKLYWNEEEIVSGDSLVKSIKISIPEMDFSGDVFIRWDLPNFFDLNNGAMFPRYMSTCFELLQTSENINNSGLMEMIMPDLLEPNQSQFSVNFNDKYITYPEVNISSKIAYEDLVVEVRTDYTDNGVIVDSFIRNIFVPETPTSDSGLVVYGDSIITSEFPEVSLIFNAENQESGRKILDLGKENILLYENEIKVDDFELGYFETEGSKLADIVFVLDCSGSMGNEIRSVKDNINNFAESLVEKGFDYKIGVITFSTTVDDIWDFTNDLEVIKSNLASVSLWGGIEDSPSAIMKAAELSWRDRSKRSIVWITDEAYPVENYTVQEVVNKMLEMSIRVHGVGLNSLQTDWFNPIVNPTGGNFYDINGNFKDILLDVANMGGEFKYQITYNSLFPDNQQNQIYLKLRYNGLGANSIFTYNVPENDGLGKEIISYYPNPFNERINFVLNLQNLKNTRVYIYDILGKKIQEYNLSMSQGYQKIFWNGHDMEGRSVSTGMYIIQLTALNTSGEKVLKTNKILYLK